MQGGRIILPGGSGFLGTALAETFARQGSEVVILTRRPGPPRGSIRRVGWERATEELDGAGAVVNLAGRSIACLHTARNRAEILSSRLESVASIHAAVAACRRPPEVLIQASAIGIYGDSGDRICDESGPAASDFIAQVVAAWEGAFFGPPVPPGVRRVALRTGFVLGREGGGLAPLERLTRLFLGGAAGSGRQYLSWIHIEDYCSICRWLIGNPGARGIYNATAPTPVTNAEFMRTLRTTLRRPWSPPAPAWAVALAGRFLVRVEPGLILQGCRAEPRRLLEEGYTWKCNSVGEALRSLY